MNNIINRWLKYDFLKHIYRKFVYHYSRKLSLWHAHDPLYRTFSIEMKTWLMRPGGVDENRQILEEKMVSTKFSFRRIFLHQFSLGKSFLIPQ